jgi:hypothetical protein
MPGSIIRPDSTVGATTLTVVGAASAHLALNDVVVQPTINTFSYIYGDQGVAHVTLQDPPPSDSQATKTLWAYGYGAYASSLVVALRKGTTTLCSINFPDGGNGWFSSFFQEGLTAAERANLNLFITVTDTDSNVNDPSFIYHAYVEIASRGLRMVV